MSKSMVLIMSKTLKTLEKMDEQIQMARLLRNLSMDPVSERTGISRAALWQIEKGSPTVSMEAYAAVLHALNGIAEHCQRRYSRQHSTRLQR